MFIPLVVAGALTGSIIGGAIDHGDLSLFIVIGVAACLGAGYRVPLAAVMFVAETTGRPSFIVPGLLAAVAAELMMGGSSITTYQRAVDVSRDAGPRDSERSASPATGQGPLNMHRSNPGERVQADRVLLVEDDHAVRALVRMLLEDEGLTVVEASTGSEAVEVFGEERIDLVLLDLRLPGLSGFEVCRRLRRHSDVPIIMVTAQHDSHDVVAGLELGADDYVTKPFNDRELMARVRAQLRRRQGALEAFGESLSIGDLTVKIDHGQALKSGRGGAVDTHGVPSAVPLRCSPESSVVEGTVAGAGLGICLRGRRPRGRHARRPAARQDRG